MKKIDVHFAGWGQRWLLGTVAGTGTELLFEYSRESITKGIEFSPRHLPLATGAYHRFPKHHEGLPGLVADALPDGWGLLLMNRFFKKHFGLDAQQVSPLDRLAFIGERAMGALVFLPATDVPLEPAEASLLELAAEVKSVSQGKDDEALKQLVLLGGSPHGARPKVLVQYDQENCTISTREQAPGTPWLVKFPSQGEHKEVCAIENLYAELARACGLDMPATRYFDLGKSMSAFGIERFDRHAGMRVPVHSLAGALHADFRIPASSYQTYLRMTRYMTKSEAEVQKAFERAAFNVIFNNRDDHTKNFAYRMEQDMSWKLAPCFDLTFSTGPGGEHQMDIEGEGRAPGRTHLLKLASSNSLDLARATQTIERMRSVADRVKLMAKEHPIRPATRNAMATAINANVNRLG